MTKQQVKEILDRVLSWPPERQADLAQVAKIMEAQDKSGLQLSPKQAAEVKRRLVEVDPETLSLSELNDYLRRRYGV